MMTTTQSNTTSAGLQKFMFDTEFEDATIAQPQGDLAEPNEEDTQESEVLAEPEFVEEIIPTFSEQEMTDAREDGKRTGREEALAEMTASLEQQMVNALNTINEQVEHLFESYAKDSEEQGRNAIAIATVIMRKLFPSLNIEHSMAEIESLIHEALQRTSGAPSLLIKVPTKLHKEIEAKVIEMAALRGHEGRITVSADDEMTIGNLHVKWDGGGILRDTTLLWEQIDEIIERNLGTSIEDITLKAPDPVQSSAQDAPIIEPAKEQEVVKPAVVSENEENVTESLDQGGIIKEASTEEVFTEESPAEEVSSEKTLGQTELQTDDKEPED